MILGFSLSNYKSFKDTQSISFLSSKITRHKDHVIKLKNKKILKSALIFGANASGKSNFIEAIEFSKNIILSGLESVSVEKKHFRLDEKKSEEPAVFDYRLLIEQNEYSYGIAISYKYNEIVAEWLIKINVDGTEEVIFERELTDESISKVTTDKNYEKDEEKTKFTVYLDDFKNNISDPLRKKTILSDISERISDESDMFYEITSVYEWFKNIIVIFPTSKYSGINSMANDDDKLSFFSKCIASFDTGIVSVEKKAVKYDNFFENIDKNDIDSIKIVLSNRPIDKPISMKIGNKIYILNKNKNMEIEYVVVQLNHGNNEDLFEYSDESDGTQRLFDLIPIFFKPNMNRTIFLDEIDRSLHTLVTRKFLELFYELNKKERTQLIVTTHDSNLLDLDLVRQDEIWFVEREKDHSSRMYSLDIFKARFDKKIEKDYLLGRYGAIPFLNNIESIGVDIDG